jgi:hypothetical protein
MKLVLLDFWWTLRESNSLHVSANDALYHLTKGPNMNYNYKLKFYR